MILIRNTGSDACTTGEEAIFPDVMSHLRNIYETA